MKTGLRRLAPVIESGPTALFVGFAILGVAVPDSIHWVSALAGIAVAFTVLVSAAARPVMLAMNLHFATVPPIFFVLISQERAAWLAWLETYIHESVTGAACLAVGLAAWLGRVPARWQAGLAAIVALTMAWAFVFFDSRLLSVGLPAIVLSQGLARARAARNGALTGRRRTV